MTNLASSIGGARSGPCASTSRMPIGWSPGIASAAIRSMCRWAWPLWAKHVVDFGDLLYEIDAREIRRLASTAHVAARRQEAQ